MGCASSTEYVVDPATGQEKKKKSLGGAYPGQRRPQHQPHVPAATEFDANGTATAHFRAYGGGNALTLVRQDGSYQPEKGPAAESTFVQVTLPPGVSPGQTIHVQAPDGKVNAITIPEGFGPGSTFTVEFEPDAEAPPVTTNQPTTTTTTPTNNNNASSIPYASATTTPGSNTANHVDDGFASGFGNAHWQNTRAVPVHNP